MLVIIVLYYIMMINDLTNNNAKKLKCLFNMNNSIEKKTDNFERYSTGNNAIQPVIVCSIVDQFT